MVGQGLRCVHVMGDTGMSVRSELMLEMAGYKNAFWLAQQSAGLDKMHIKPFVLVPCGGLWINVTKDIKQPVKYSNFDSIPGACLCYSKLQQSGAFTSEG
ncbi:putative YD-repeat toxin [Salmonella phage 19]|nr:putative YD-repeat toxin [Salmonella phage 19]